MSDTTQHSPHHVDVKEFHPRAHEALHNPQIRQNFRKAMDGLMSKRKSAFEGWDLETLRDLGANVRLRALANLPDLLEQLEQKLTENGIKVHWAVDGDEACRIVRDICKARDAKTVIKGKSMVSEEMELNHYLEEQGIEAWNPIWASTSCSWPRKRPHTSLCRRSTRTPVKSPNCCTKKPALISLTMLNT